MEHSVNFAQWNVHHARMKLFVQDVMGNGYYREAILVSARLSFLWLPIQRCAHNVSIVASRVYPRLCVRLVMRRSIGCCQERIVSVLLGIMMIMLQRCVLNVSIVVRLVCRGTNACRVILLPVECSILIRRYVNV